MISREVGGAGGGGGQEKRSASHNPRAYHNDTKTSHISHLSEVPSPPTQQYSKSLTSTHGEAFGTRSVALTMKWNGGGCPGHQM